MLLGHCKWKSRNIQVVSWGIKVCCCFFCFFFWYSGLYFKIRFAERRARYDFGTCSSKDYFQMSVGKESASVPHVLQIPKKNALCLRKAWLKPSLEQHTAWCFLCYRSMPTVPSADCFWLRPVRRDFESCDGIKTRRVTGRKSARHSAGRTLRVLAFTARGICFQRSQAA